MKLKKYILEVRQITITQAAKELGYSRVRITDVGNGASCSIKLAKKIEDWSNGIVSAREMLGV